MGKVAPATSKWVTKSAPKSTMAGKMALGKTLTGLPTAIRGRTETLTSRADTAMPQSPAQAEANLKQKLNELKIIDLAADNNDDETNV
jgi:hypothetical protein